jgi:ABC-type lipoprotein release transport system permease subunit
VKLVVRDGSSFDFHVVAIIDTGISSKNDSKLWVILKDAQILANQYNEITDIGVKLTDYETAEAYAESFGKKFGYKTESWQGTGKIGRCRHDRSEY